MFLFSVYCILQASVEIYRERKFSFRELSFSSLILPDGWSDQKCLKCLYLVFGRFYFLVRLFLPDRFPYHSLQGAWWEFYSMNKNIEQCAYHIHCVYNISPSKYVLPLLYWKLGGFNRKMCISISLSSSLFILFITMIRLLDHLDYWHFCLFCYFITKS